MSRSAHIVICGAGIAGVSAAYQLARAGARDILVLDSRPPLSLTSDRSTEGYRNWWPDPAMLALMNRSIDLMEELAEASGNRFRMNRRGYLYLTANENKLSDFTQRATHIAAQGAGPLRIHSVGGSDYQPSSSPGFDATLGGADLLLDPTLIQKHFPCVTEQALAAIHVRRAGWLSAQQLGMYLLELARERGIRLEPAGLESVDTTGGRVRAVTLTSGERINCSIFVNAAGPFLAQVGAMLGVDIPVQAELHLKATFKDHLQVLDRAAPLLIWEDTQRLPWEPDELDSLRSDADTCWLTEPFPAGVHIRPDGPAESQNILMLWDYNARCMPPTFPPPLDELYPEIVLRGLAAMLPGLKRYFGRAPRPYLDGGYYMKTPENRLLSGPLPLEGAYVIGGLSGYGIMSSCAAGELLAAHITGSRLPGYATVFSPQRYEDRGYREKLSEWELGGEL